MSTALVRYQDANLPSFPIQRFAIRRRIVQPVGPNLYVLDSNGSVIFFGRVRGFKIDDDLFLYADEKLTQPVLRIHPRYAVELGKTYDVRDLSGSEPKELGSIFRPKSADEPWTILDLDDKPLSEIHEQPAGKLSAVGRFLRSATPFMPREFLLMRGSHPVVSLKQSFRPSEQRVDGHFLDNKQDHDRRLMFAAAVLMCLIEGKRKR